MKYVAWLHARYKSARNPQLTTRSFLFTIHEKSQIPEDLAFYLDEAIRNYS
jgi:hypothetical protein